MFSKIALITCLFGIARAGFLFSAGSSNAGYNQGGYGGYSSNDQSSYNSGYGGQGGAVSYVSFKKEITPSVPITVGYAGNNAGWQGYSGDQGYASNNVHGISYNSGLGYNTGSSYPSSGLNSGYQSGSGGSGYNSNSGYSHAISTGSQYSIQTPAVNTYRAHAPTAYISQPSSYSNYGNKGW